MGTGRTLAGGLAVGVAGYSVTWLALSLTLPAPASLLPVLPDLRWNALETSAETAAPRGWPALFGTPPAPVTAAAPEPVPPDFTTQLVLKGLISAAGGGWAILGDGADERLVRAGDDLGDGVRVAAIDGDGVTLARGAARLVLRFSETAPAVAFDAPDTGAPASAGDATEAVERQAVELDLTGLDRRDLRRLLARAGGVSVAAQDDGGAVIDVLWVRPGQLYDRIGLQQGDRLISLNGVALGDNDAVLAASARLLAAQTYTIELARNGRRMAISVDLVKHD